MVIDTSVLVAIVLGEENAPTYIERLTEAREPISLSAATLVEAGIVVESRQGPDATRDLFLLLETVGAEVAAFDETQAHLALTAWRRFGKGRHPAGLNLGDCFAYAAAAASGQPLLFQGDDFAQTDVTAAHA